MMWRQFVALLVTVAALEVHARSLKSPAGEAEQLPSEVYELLAQCSDFCKNASRHCLSPPRRCGACLTDYLERDGLCFYRYNPADEVDAWEQALRLANEGIESKSADRAAAVDSRPPPTNNHHQQLQQHHLQQEDDQLPLLDTSNDSPETEDDTETGGDDGGHDEDDERAEQRDEFVDEKEVRSSVRGPAAAEVQEASKIVEQQETDRDSAQSAVRQSIISKTDLVKDAVQIHELPTPAAMVQLAAKERDSNNNPLSEFYTLAIVIGCAVVSIFVLVGAGLCYYRYHQNAKAASAVEYPGAFVPGGGGGQTGVPREQRAGSGDRKLAQSAQMYHYQHQKQQMIAAERASDELNKDEESEDEENEEGDYTVYECPGLAPTGEMEVKNPLFADEGTTVTASADSPKKD